MDSTSNLDLLDVNQAAHDVTANALFAAATGAITFAMRASTTAALTWGYYGGRFNGTLVANGTLSLTGSSTNYVVVHKTTLAITVSTANTNWLNTSTYGRCYKITTGAAAVTGYEDHREAIDGTGIFSPNIGAGGGLLAANNLSDVASAATSRTNLGLGTSATHAASDFALVANNLSDLANAGTARTNLGLGTSATHPAGDFLLAASNLSDVANASTARTNLGLGTAATLASSALIHADGSVAFGADQSLGSHKLTNVTDPSSAQDAATKAYVDALAVNLGKRARVRAATTANITISTALNNGDSLDGVTLATGELVLVKNQTAPEENGVYVVGVSPARDAQFDTYDEHPGSLLAVEEGTANADTLWLCTSNAGGTLNTTALAFTSLSVSAAITELTGDVTAGPGSGSQATTLATVNSNVGSFGDGTHVAAVTVNAKGLVTAASSVAITGAAPTGSAGGDLTGTYPNPTIAANAVTLADMAQIATARILGRTTASTGNVESLTATQAKTVLAIASSDVSGLATVATSGSASDLGSGTLPAARMPALTGDVTTSAGAVAATLATVNSNVGSFTNASITVNGKGLVTAASSGAGGSTLTLTEAPSDQSYTGSIVSLTYGESLTPGTPVYFKSDGKVWKADANGSSTYPCIGLAMETASSGSHVVLLFGIYRDDALFNWTVGGLIYLSTTAGTLTQTPPSATNDVIQVIGVATHADRMLVNPQLQYVVHA